MPRATLAADYATTVNASELLPGSVNLKNSLVFSTGCHAGYNLVDPDGIAGVTQTADWAQVLSRKGATLVAGTGFQYGDDELIEYSERIYAEFAHQLRVGSGPVAVGDALVRSKLAYLAATPEVKGMHQKALLTASVFGLPMFSLNMPGTRDGTGGGPGPSIVGPIDASSGVAIGNVNLTNSQFQVPAASSNGPNGTTYLTGRNGVASNPGEPALPRYVGNVGVSGKVLRGVGLLGRSFHGHGRSSAVHRRPRHGVRRNPDAVLVDDILSRLGCGQPATSVICPVGLQRSWSTPAQHKVQNPGDATATRRLFSNLNLRLFYANAGDPAAAQAAVPTIGNVTAVLAGSVVTVNAVISGTNSTGADNVKTAWLTYSYGNTGCTCWTSVLLTRSAADPTQWSATLGVGGNDPAALRFIVQAANSAALVGINDNHGAYFSLASATGATPEATNLTVSAGASSGTYGGSVSVSATLKRGTTALDGKSVLFRIGTSSAYGTTNGSGIATATLPLSVTPGALQIEATFAGDAANLGSGNAVPFSVQKQATILAINVPGSAPLTLSSGLSATLTAGGSPVGSRTIYFVLTGNGAGTTGSGFSKAVTTDATGTGYLGTTPNLPFGSYSVRAYFAGTIPLDPWTGSTTLTLSDPIYVNSSSPAAAVTVARLSQTITLTVPAQKVLGEADFAISATSSSGLPVSLSASGPCTISGTTVHLTNIGTCTVNASHAGTALYAPAATSASITVIWPWGGFYSPVDNGVMNVATGGSSIPVKFSLGGDRGLTGIFATGYPKPVKVDCASGSEDAIEEFAPAGTSGLQYDAASQRYSYVWKTAKAYKGYCYRLDVKLADGTMHSASFKFK